MERDSQRTGFVVMSGLESAVEKLNLMVGWTVEKNTSSVFVFEGRR